MRATSSIRDACNVRAASSVPVANTVRDASSVRDAGTVRDAGGVTVAACWAVLTLFQEGPLASLEQAVLCLTCCSACAGTIRYSGTHSAAATHPIVAPSISASSTPPTTALCSDARGPAAGTFANQERVE